MDQAVASMCGRWGGNYTRVYDDLTVSLQRQQLVRPAEDFLEKHIQRAGLRISQRKKRRTGFQAHHRLQFVHGLIVNSRRGVRINDEQKRKTLELADNYVRGARGVSPESLPGLAAVRRKLTGWMYNCRQAEFSPARHLRRQLDAGDMLVRRKLRANGVMPFKNKWWVVSYGKRKRVIRDEPARLKRLWLTRRNSKPGRADSTRRF